MIFDDHTKQAIIHDEHSNVICRLDSNTGEPIEWTQGDEALAMQTIMKELLATRRDLTEALRGRDALIAGHHQPTASQAEREIKALRATMRDIHEIATDAQESGAPQATALLLIAGMVRDAY